MVTRCRQATTPRSARLDGATDPGAAREGDDQRQPVEAEAHPVHEAPDEPLLEQREPERDGDREDEEPAEKVGVTVGREGAVGLERERAPLDDLEPGELQDPVAGHDDAGPEQGLGEPAHARRAVRELQDEEVDDGVVDEREQPLVAARLAEQRRRPVDRGDRGERHPGEKREDEPVERRAPDTAALAQHVPGPGPQSDQPEHALERHLDDVERVEGEGRAEAEEREVADRDRAPGRPWPAAPTRRCGERRSSGDRERRPCPSRAKRAERAARRRPASPALCEAGLAGACLARLLLAGGLPAGRPCVVLGFRQAPAPLPGSAPGEHHAQGLGHDLCVHGQGLMIHVDEIVLELALGRRSRSRR